MVQYASPWNRGLGGTSGAGPEATVEFRGIAVVCVRISEYARETREDPSEASSTQDPSRRVRLFHPPLGCRFFKFARVY